MLRDNSSQVLCTGAQNALTHCDNTMHTLGENSYNTVSEPRWQALDDAIVVHRTGVSIIFPSTVVHRLLMCTYCSLLPASS